MKNIFSFSAESNENFLYKFGEKEPVIEQQDAEPEDLEIKENPEQALKLETQESEDMGPDTALQKKVEQTKADLAVENNPELDGKLEAIDQETQAEVPSEENLQPVQEQANQFVESLDANNAQQGQAPEVTESTEQEKAA